MDHHRAEGDWFSTYGDDRSKGGPFSALTPSMWPARGIDGHGDGKYEFNEDEEDVHYDEFGFRYIYIIILLTYIEIHYLVVSSIVFFPSSNETWFYTMTAMF